VPKLPSNFLAHFPFSTFHRCCWSFWSCWWQLVKIGRSLRWLFIGTHGQPNNVSHQQQQML